MRLGLSNAVPSKCSLSIWSMKKTGVTKVSTRLLAVMLNRRAIDQFVSGVEREQSKVFCETSMRAQNSEDPAEFGGPLLVVP